ncbi:MAG TPA: tetratricopeptide repeat protein [Candidatus Acidoferrales bacterium]|nr:tetratricopeptide repeat protein [Candidatus Acidoferrales bacterium]
MSGSSTGKHVRVLVALAFVAAWIGLGAAAWTASAQQIGSGDDAGIRVEASPQIFATMCALDAAGFDADESTLAEMPARLTLRADLLKLQGPATDAVRQFYRDHVLASPTETLSRYITFALTADPPPGFQLPAIRESLPPDVIAIDGFQDVLAGFYREARLDLRWAKLEPESEPAVERYRVSLRKIVMVSDAYLREIIKASTGRTFTVYVEPLVGARTNFRNSGDRYAIVVGAVADIPTNTIQHAYLHFMLDPLVLRYRPAVYSKRALLDTAARAPQLPVEYHDDFIALTDECLVRAAELRLRHLPPNRLEAALKAADESGFILVRPFVAQLQKFEKAEPAMSYYFPDLITGIDVQAEQKRLQGVIFAAAGAGSETDEHGESASAQPSELEQWLAEGNRAIARRDALAATATFQTALAKYPGDARAEYGLAIASVLSGQGDRARELFEKLVSAPNPAQPADPAVVSWSHVYLGRIHDLQDERDLAVNEYRAALAVNGAPEAARVAAQSGVESAYKAPERPANNGQQQP